MEDFRRFDVPRSQNGNLDFMRSNETITCLRESFFLTVDFAYPAVAISDRKIVFTSLRQSNREALLETLERDVIVGRGLVDNSNVMQYLGDTMMLRSNSDLVYPQRLLVEFLSKLEVMKPLVVASDNKLGGDDDQPGMRRKKYC